MDLLRYFSVLLLLSGLLLASSTSFTISECSAGGILQEPEFHELSLLQAKVKAKRVSQVVATNVTLPPRQNEKPRTANGAGISALPEAERVAALALAALQGVSFVGHRMVDVAEEVLLKPAGNSTKKAGNSTKNMTDKKGLLWMDTSKLSMRTFEPILKAILCLAIIGAIIFELVHYRWAEADLSLELEYGVEHKENDLMRLFAGVRPLVAPYFSNPESSGSWMYVSALITFGVIELALTLMWMKFNQEFWNSLQNKKQEEYMRLLRDFLILTSAWAIIGTYNSYVSRMMSIHWRKFLTELLLKKWLGAKVYYHLQLGGTAGSLLDNPDQRIQEDVPSFIDSTIDLFGGLLMSVGHLVTMLPVLLIISPTYAFGVFYCPGWLAILSLLYSGMGTVVAHYIGRQLILIHFVMQKYEANFRYYIVQVRDHAESIALYGAEDVEQMKVEQKFSWLIRTWWMLMKYKKRFGFFQTFYSRASGIFPYLVLAPNYFKGQITLGTMFALFAALGYVKSSFDWIVNSYTTLTDYRATVDRLSNFWTAVDTALEKLSLVERLESAPGSNAPLDKPLSEAALVAQDMCVQLPGSDHRKLWDKANLIVKPGQFILLTAPEGTGKSCFFRALAGIWPHATGSVFMKDHSLFLPQRPFVPQGTLRQAIAYPEKADKYTDEQVRSALEVVKLHAIKDRDLSEEANWELALSGGEQQKLAIAHVVLHRPEVLFLDEATSALSEEGTMEVYKLLRRKGTLPEGAAVLSISHDQQLLEQFHDVHYTYDATSRGWALVPKTPA